MLLILVLDSTHSIADHDCIFIHQNAIDVKLIRTSLFMVILLLSLRTLPLLL